MKFPAIALLAKPRPHQVSSLNAIGAVLKRNGYRVRESYDETAPEPVVFCWSWGKAMIQRQKYPDTIICCLDHGYTRDRANLINTGWSVGSMAHGLNGFAEHAWVRDGGTRAQEMGWDLELRAERPDNRREALLLGQVYGDAMIRGIVTDYNQWLRETADELTVEGYRVTFRPHPVMVRRGQSGAYGNLGRLSPYGDLWADLNQADLAVALNSNGLVAAFLHGVQPRAYNGGTMLAPVMDGIAAQFRVRREWLGRLAWAQWHVRELEDGTWFKHHQPIMHRIMETGQVRPWNMWRPEDLT